MFTIPKPKISAEMWRNLDTSLIWVYRGHVPRSHQDVTTRTKNLTAWLVINGEGSVTFEKRRMEAKSGQWLLLGPGARHQVFHPRTRLLSIHFRMAWLTGQPVFPETISLRLEKEECGALERAALALEDFISQRLDRPSLELLRMPLALEDHLRMQELLGQWIQVFCDTVQRCGFAMRFPQENDKRIQRTLQILGEWPLDSSFNEEKLASQVGISPGHLNRLFQAELAFTPCKVFENRRLDYVKRTLRLPNSSVKEVAATLGFKHLGNFSKWFHRLEGTSPREFQRANDASLLT